MVHAVCDTPKGASFRNARSGCRWPTPAPFSVAGVGVPVITQRACALSAHAIESLAVMAFAPPIWCPSSSTTRAQCTLSKGESRRENSVLRRFEGISTISHRDASAAEDKPSNEGNELCAVRFRARAKFAKRSFSSASRGVVAPGVAPGVTFSGDTPNSHRASSELSLW